MMILFVLPWLVITAIIFLYPIAGTACALLLGVDYVRLVRTHQRMPEWTPCFRVGWHMLIGGVTLLLSIPAGSLQVLCDISIFLSFGVLIAAWFQRRALHRSLTKRVF